MIFPSIAYGAELERRFNAPLRPLGFKKGFLKKPFFPFWCFVHVCWFRGAYVLRIWVFLNKNHHHRPQPWSRNDEKRAAIPSTKDTLFYDSIIF